MILINSSSKNALRMFQPFLPIFVPVGIGCLLGIAEKKGIKVRHIDEQIENNILGLIAEYVKDTQKPYIFGFSVLTIAFKNAIVLSMGLKRIYPDSIIVFGGVHPTAVPEEVLSYHHIDAVIRGEAEKTLFDFYLCVKENKDFTHLNNISYRRNGGIIHNKRGPIIDDLDTLPRFPYHLFTSKHYDLGFIVSSRGCPYDCIFCSNRITTGKKYRYKSAQAILEELTLLYRRYKRNFVLFLDDNLLVDKKRLFLLVEGIKKEGLDKKMTFSCQGRGDNVNRQLLKDLYDSGFKSIFFGLETSSDKVMRAIKKNESVTECVEAVRLAKKIGYHVSATFIYGLPEETHLDRMNCVKLSNELGIDMIRYNNATPYPGTELYDIAKRENRLKIDGLYENFVSVGTFIESPFKKIPLPYIPVGTSEAQIRRDILFSYFNFYLNLSKIKMIFVEPEQGVGWFNAGDNLLDILKKIPAIFTLVFMLFIKFIQLFYYAVINKETSLSFRFFLNVFNPNFVLRGDNKLNNGSGALTNKG